MRKRHLRIKRSLKNQGPGWARRQKTKHMAGGASVSQKKRRKLRGF